MALHLPIGPLKNRSGLDPVPRCEPSTYQPISRCLNHCAIGVGFQNIWEIRVKINRDYYQSVFGYRQYHVLGIKIVLCEPLASIIHYFLFPIHDTADTQRHEGNNLFII